MHPFPSSLPAAASRRVFPLCVIASLFALTPLVRAQFVPDGTISVASTTAQGLASGTGTVTGTGSLTVSGATAAITVTGTSAVNNSGTISQTGTGQGLLLDTKNVTLTITNQAGATIETADADTIRLKKGSDIVTLNNYGSIISNNASVGGAQAIDWADVNNDPGAGSTHNTLNNFATGSITATGADAVRPGVNGVINNQGAITATPVNDTTVSELDVTSSDGIDAQTNSGVQVANSGSISGRHGITGGDAALTTFVLSVDNQAGGTITGVNGSGINIDGVFAGVVVTVTNAQGATIRGGVLGVASAVNGDGDGVDVDGVAQVTNRGDILAYGALGVGSDLQANNPEAISIGGGSVTNYATGRIIGSTLASDAPNGDATREGHGVLVDDSSGGGAVAATTIDNYGLIQGRTGYGIKIVGTYADTINNYDGGVIQGGKAAASGSYAPVIDTGGGDDVVSNAGSIISDGGNAATAVALGDGNDHLTISGAHAVVTGGIDGGTGSNTLTFNLGAPDRTFVHGGVIANFATVEILSGKVTLNGNNLYTGVTTIGNGTDAATLIVNGAHTSGAGAYTLNAAATLGGSGRIGGDLVASGLVAPGVGIGTLTVDGNVTWNGSAGNAWRFELGSGNQADLLSLTGDFLKGSGSVFDFDFVNGGTIGTYVLVDWDGTTTFSASDFAYTNLASGLLGTFQVAGNQLMFTTAAVPEPATTAACFGLVVIGLACWVRRCRAA